MDVDDLRKATLLPILGENISREAFIAERGAIALRGASGRRLTYARPD